MELPSDMAGYKSSNYVIGLGRSSHTVALFGFVLDSALYVAWCHTHILSNSRGTGKSFLIAVAWKSQESLWLLQLELHNHPWTNPEARSMVSPDWPILGHVLTPVAGNRERVQGSRRPIWTTSSNFTLGKKNTIAGRHGKRKGGGAKEKQPLHGFSKSEKFQRLLKSTALSLACLSPAPGLWRLCPRLLPGQGPWYSQQRFPLRISFWNSAGFSNPWFFFVLWPQWGGKNRIMMIILPGKLIEKTCMTIKITSLYSWIYLYHLNWYART